MSKLKDLWLLPRRMKKLYAAVNNLGKDIDRLEVAVNDRTNRLSRDIGEAHHRLDILESIDVITEVPE